MWQSVLKTCRVYVCPLAQLLIEPGPFFKGVRYQTGIRKVCGFLMICCIFFTISSLLTGVYPGPVRQMAAVFFAGTAGMVLLSSLLGYIAMIMIAGKKAGYAAVFSVYAYSHGITLFISWLPFFLWFSEPWKWWLIFTGLKITCGLKGRQAFLVLVSAMTVQFFFMYSGYMAVIHWYGAADGSV